LKARRIIFRADASSRIGSGHLMRCLTLADVLRAGGAETVFVCRTLLEPLRDRIADAGHVLVMLPEAGAQHPDPGTRLAHADWLPTSQLEDAALVVATIEGTPCDWLVVDHYALDARWETAMRPYCGRLIVLDDLADRPHDCDLLLDQNLGRHADDYVRLVPAECEVLIGPHYALLRPEFAEARQATNAFARRQDGKIGRLLVSLGGVNPDSIAMRVLDALGTAALPPDCRITVVAGLSAPHLGELRDRLAAMPWQTDLLVGVKDMASLMADNDLAIGAAGGTAWERCAVGLPTLLLILAENQVTGARALAETGAALLVSLATLERDLPLMLATMQTEVGLQNASRAAAAVTDGGGAVRVAEAMRVAPPPLVVVRPADPSDEDRLLAWANDPVTRQNAFQPKAISAEGHRAWFAARLAQPDAHRLFIGERQPGLPVGQVRFDLLAGGDWEISYALSPLHRGQGLGAPMLAAAMTAMQAAVGPVAFLARVKPVNIPSLRIFERLEFVRQADEEETHATFRKLPGQT